MENSIPFQSISGYPQRAYLLLNREQGREGTEEVFSNTHATYYLTRGDDALVNVSS